MSNSEIIVPLPLPVGSIYGFNTSAGTSLAYVGNHPVASDLAGLVWRGTANTGNGIIDFDFGEDVSIDRLMMFGLRGFPAAAQIQVSCSTAAQGPTYAGWVRAPSSVYAGSARLINGAGVCYMELTNPSPAPAARYWRLSILNVAGAEIEIGRICLGKKVKQERNFEYGLKRGVRDFSEVDFSKRGAFLRRRSAKLRTIMVSYPIAYVEEIEKHIHPMLDQIGNSESVALITDPDTHDMRERRCYFGPLFGDIDSVWRNAKAYAWQADMVSLF